MVALVIYAAVSEKSCNYVNFYSLIARISANFTRGFHAAMPIAKQANDADCRHFMRGAKVDGALVIQDEHLGIFHIFVANAAVLRARCIHAPVGAVIPCPE